jgi:hypothetical protein
MRPRKFQRLQTGVQVVGVRKVIREQLGIGLRIAAGDVRMAARAGPDLARGDRHAIEGIQPGCGQAPIARTADLLKLDLQVGLLAVRLAGGERLRGDCRAGKGAVAPGQPAQAELRLPQLAGQVTIPADRAAGAKSHRAVDVLAEVLADHGQFAHQRHPGAGQHLAPPNA